MDLKLKLNIYLLQMRNRLIITNYYKLDIISMNATGT